MKRVPTKLAMAGLLATGFTSVAAVAHRVPAAIPFVEIADH